jgi:3-dehydroquinate dehydratase
MKPSFIKTTKRPLLVPILTDRTPEDCIATMRNAIYDGADAFAIMYGNLEACYRNSDDLKRFFPYAEDKPILIINYRRKDSTDEDLVAENLVTIEAGATMVDIMGDMYDPSPMQLTMKPEAIDRQKKLVEKIHSIGGEVLMSSHTFVPMTAEQTIEHAKALEARGVDMIKIAMSAYTEDDLLEVIKTTALLKRELKIPYFHICMGQYGKVHRAIAPMFGSALALCVQSYTTAGHKEQVLLRATKAVYDNLDWRIARDDLLGSGKVRRPADAGVL